MPEINKKQPSHRLAIAAIIFLLIGFVLLMAFLLQGKNIALFNPQGVIAHEQFNLMMFIVTVMFAIAIPTLITLFFITWRYRENNVKAIHSPNARHSKYLVVVVWAIPISVILMLASVMVPATHRLSPHRPLDSDVKSMKIQVISLRWKWLFIYPDQQIATVNFVQIPVDTPVEFELTADETPMSSFWIPNLGGQLYSMTSHVNRLNLMANNTGDFPGSTPEINGAGFAGMRFTTRVSSSGDFDNWVESVKQSPDNLNAAKYQELLSPSENNPVALYSSFDPNLYAKVIIKYQGPGGGHEH